MLASFAARFADCLTMRRGAGRLQDRALARELPQRMRARREFRRPLPNRKLVAGADMRIDASKGQLDLRFRVVPDGCETTPQDV
jgi:hypothetical protein